MKRWLLLLAACGSSGTKPTDARSDVAHVDAPADGSGSGSGSSSGGGSNAGFVPPPTAVTAWTGSAGAYTQVTPDLSCLGAARTDAPTTVAVTLTVTVRDFQSSNVVPNATVAAYSTFGSPFATALTDSSGIATLAVPVGTRRIGFAITEAQSHETITPDQLLAPSTAAQAMTLHVLSDSTVATLPALVGLTYQAGTAIVLGTIHDCAGANLGGAIATVSSSPTTATHLAGADTYYFADSVDLPVHHNQQPYTSHDALFMVIGLPATTTAYVQVWGFRTAADQLAGTLTEIAELAVPLPASAGIVTVQDPRATN